MALLIATLVSVALVALLVALTVVEKRQGRRVFAGARARLDAESARAAFIATNTDVAGTLLHFIRLIAAHIAHDVTAMVLRAIRMLERGLATLHVRLRRARRTDAPQGSRFVKSISYYKRSLRSPEQSPSETTDTVG